MLALSAANAFAQAEEAPASYEPPPGVPISAAPSRIASEREARARLWTLSVQPRFVVAMGDGAGLPRIGFGAGVSVGRALLVRGRGRLGLGASFSYERHQHERVPPPDLENGDTVQWLSHAAFSIDLRVDGLFASGVVRPWATLGPAVSIAAYSDPPSPGNKDGLAVTQVLPALRAAFGVAGTVAASVEVGGRVEWVATFKGDAFGAPPVRPTVPGNFSVGLDVGFRF